MTTVTCGRWIRRTLRFRRQLRIGARIGTVGLFVLIVVVMGSGYVAIRIGVASVPPLFLAALRFYFTAAVLLAVVVTMGRAWRPATRADWAAVGVLGALVFAGAIGFLFVGQQHTTASTAAVVMCLGPVLTALIARALLPDEQLSRRRVAGIGFGFLGAVVIAQPVSTGLALGTGRGVVMVLCAAASGSLGGVLLGRLRTTAAPTVQAAWGALLGGVVLHAASVGFGEPVGAVSWTPGLLWLLLYLSVVVGGVGYVAFLVLLRTVGSTRTSLTAYASPLVALLLGWLFLHESPTVTVLVGFALIVVGFALARR